MFIGVKTHEIWIRVRQDRNFQISLLIYSLKKLAASRLELEVQQLKAAQKPNTYENGLSNPEKNLLHYNMFGPDGGAQPTERMKSLFDSTINLAFPQAGECKSDDVYA